MTCLLILMRCIFDMYIDMYMYIVMYIMFFHIMLMLLLFLIYKMYYEYTNDFSIFKLNLRCITHLNLELSI
jgi:hypothetical protein